ncbi:Protein CNPPD1 [Orchesella cincta]|uniref:Protein CNPPD1 n=1 Tax=Orchesella cincta TaxID=48709 RepID=A0A1D2MV03_ORCCI|nr:Protein CNPPD1 [Orchesella cincta]
MTTTMASEDSASLSSSKANASYSDRSVELNSAQNISGRSSEKKHFARKSPKKTEAAVSRKVLKMTEAEAKRKSTPSSNGDSESSKTKKEEKRKTEKAPEESDSDSEAEVSFEDYSVLCERFAKSMYYSNSIPTTPRPSLPLTILAVDTFTKYARKDTLEFLDIDMAAEIGRNACVSPTALVFALVYLERLSAHNPGYLKTVKPSELFVVSLLVASKFVQDDGEDLGIFNDEWATSANMELRRINQLELEFLTAIDWSVNVGREEYERALKGIEGKVALYQGSKRGWFTYTELKSLANTQLAWNAIVPVIYQRLIEVASAVCIMYTTFFATFITSSVLAPYLLSASKLFMAAGTANSLFMGSSLSSCLEPNTTIPLSREMYSLASSIASNRPAFVPAEILLPSMEDDENSTETAEMADVMNERINSAILQHRRFIETPYENYGISLKCESHHHQCHNHNKQDQAQALSYVVQRFIENLLQAGNAHNSRILGTESKNNLGLSCSVVGGDCLKSNYNNIVSKSKILRV